MSTPGSAIGDRASDAETPASPARPVQAARSLAFALTYVLYLIFCMGLGQRLIVWPLVTLLPTRRRALMRRWLRAHARITIALARSLAGVRLTIHGSIPPEPCVVVMNHQSLLDIPLGVLLIRGPYPMIPTRDRYRRGIPGISPLTRLSRFPVVSQRQRATREELVRLREVAQQVAAGEQSLLIFPEGHRSRDGEIADFMKSGLKLILARAHRPVYCIVADGMWRSRTFADAAFRFAGTRVEATVLGPFSVPTDPERLEAFIDELRTRMIAALGHLRHGAAAPGD